MDVIGDMEYLIEVIVRRDIQYLVTVTVTHNELIFQLSNINLVDGTNKWKTSQTTQWNTESRLFKRFESDPTLESSF